MEFLWNEPDSSAGSWFSLFFSLFQNNKITRSSYKTLFSSVHGSKFTTDDQKGKSVVFVGPCCEPSSSPQCSSFVPTTGTHVVVTVLSFFFFPWHDKTDRYVPVPEPIIHSSVQVAFHVLFFVHSLFLLRQTRPPPPPMWPWWSSVLGWRTRPWTRLCGGEEIKRRLIFTPLVDSRHVLHLNILVLIVHRTSCLLIQLPDTWRPHQLV